MFKLSQKDLNDKYGYSNKLWSRRREDLINHLKEYMDLEVVMEGKRVAFFVYEDELPEEIPSLPRKNAIKEKIKDYEDYVKEELTEEFKPTSKAKMARDAIDKFGREKYGHRNFKKIAQSYVGPAMDEYGERSDKMVWVFAKTYQPLNEEELNDLAECFRKESMGEEEIANAFFREVQGEVGALEEKKCCYKRAMDMFVELRGGYPIKVYSFKTKSF